MLRVAGTTSLLGVALAISAVACDREKRGFEVPRDAAQVPEGVPYQNRLRPGPGSNDVSSSSQPVDEASLKNQPYGYQFFNNAQAQSDGQKLYEYMNCVGCHAHGGGGMAPPFLDNKWIYGSAPQNLYESILLGRPNGMPSYRGRMADVQIWEIVAYVRSMSGLANKNAASGREDHMHAQPVPNSQSPYPPITQPEPATGPATNAVPPERVP